MLPLYRNSLAIMTWMFNTVVETFRDLVYLPYLIIFSVDDHIPIDTIRMKFDQFPVWLESKLRASSREELLELDDSLTKFNDTIASMHAFSVSIRSGASAHNTSQQSNKLIKIGDLIDQVRPAYALKSRSGAIGSSHSQGQLLPSTLPDSNSLTDFISRTRVQLKLIEDLAFSKKSEVGGKNHKGGKGAASGRTGTASNSGAYSMGTGGGAFNSSSFSDGKKGSEINFIRTAVRTASNQLADIELRMKGCESTLTYFAEIKALVSRPLHDCTVRIRSLPLLSEMRSALDAEYEVLRKVDEQYNIARRADLLVEAAVLKSEVGMLESVAERSLEGIRAVFSDDFIAAVQNSDSADDLMESTSFLFGQWFGELLGYMRLPLAELLKGCTRE